MRREQIGLNLLEEMDLCEGSRTGLLGEGELGRSWLQGWVTVR